MGYRVSANLDQLNKLPPQLEHLYHNYRWKQRYPDIPNRVECIFDDDQFDQASAMYKALYDNKYVCFKNWI